jgi:hypothetical protein
LATTAGAQPYDTYYRDPAYGAPAYGDPAYGDPAYGDPSYGDPGYDQAYGPYDAPYGDNGYCDPDYGCPDDYYDLPLYYGDVFYDNAWLTGPFYYRDYGGRRQFWVHGGWRGGNWRGGRFGPALGRDFYRNHGFGGRSFNRAGNFGYQNYSRQAYQPNYSWNRGGFGSFGNNWNRQGFNRGFQRQDNFQGMRGRFQNQQAAPQQFGGGGWNRGGGWRSNFQAQQQAAPQQFGAGGWNRGGGGRGNFQAQQQAAPQQFGGGGWNRGGRGNFQGQ